MKKQLQKTMIGLLGTAAFTGLSTKAIATPITADLTSFIGNAGTYTSAVTPVHAWDGGNIGFGPGGAGDCAANDCTALPAVGRGRVGGADSMNGSVETTRNFGWSHTIKWYTFNVANSGGYTISMDRLSANINNQPAFSVWSSGANAWDGTGGSNSFNQVAAPGTVTSVASGISALNSRGNEGLPYFMTGGANDITGFVGYANSGASFTNGEGFAVKGALTAGTSTEGPLQDPSKHYGNLNKYTSIVTKGSFVDAHAGAITAPYAGVGASVNTSDPTLANAVGGGHADLQLWLPAGWYVMAGGGSCADFTCTATAATSSQYAFKILPNAAVSAPVPVPAAVWLFGSALAGMGAIGRRKQQMT